MNRENPRGESATSSSTINGAKLVLEETEPGWKKFLRHPLTVLAATTLLGSILIPVVTSLWSEAKMEREARRTFVQQLLQYDASTRQSLLIMHTRLWKFELTMQSFKPTSQELRAEQLTLLRKTLDEWVTFDDGFWVQQEQIPNEIRLRGLASDSQVAAIQADINSYIQRVWTARDALQKLWMDLLTEGYQPGSDNTKRDHDAADRTWKDIADQGRPYLVHAGELIQAAKPH